MPRKKKDRALTPRHAIVLGIIVNAGKRITQLQISRHDNWLGSHPVHEAHLKIDHQQSTLRQIRQLINDLRYYHGSKILSDREGYWIGNREEAIKALTRLEKTVRSQAKAWMRTYKALKENFGLDDSDFFETQGKLF